MLWYTLRKPLFTGALIGADPDQGGPAYIEFIIDLLRITGLRRVYYRDGGFKGAFWAEQIMYGDHEIYTLMPGEWDEILALIADYRTTHPDARG